MIALTLPRLSGGRFGGSARRRREFDSGPVDVLGTVRLQIRQGRDSPARQAPPRISFRQRQSVALVCAAELSIVAFVARATGQGAGFVRPTERVAAFIANDGALPAGRSFPARLRVRALTTTTCPGAANRDEFLWISAAARRAALIRWQQRDIGPRSNRPRPDAGAYKCVVTDSSGIPNWADATSRTDRRHCTGAIAQKRMFHRVTRCRQSCAARRRVSVGFLREDSMQARDIGKQGVERSERRGVRVDPAVHSGVLARSPAGRADEVRRR